MSGDGRLALVADAGEVPRALVAALLEDGWSVRVFDDAGHDGEGVERVPGPLADRERLAKAVAGVDVVFRTLSGGDAGIPADPVAAHDAGADATLALLEAARGVPLRRLVLAAPAESDEPHGFAAIQRAASEVYAGLYRRLHGLETVSLRYPPRFSAEAAARAIRRAAWGDPGLGAVVAGEAPPGVATGRGGP